MNKRVQIFRGYEAFEFLEENLQALWFADIFLDKCLLCIIRLELLRKEEKNWLFLLLGIPANKIKCSIIC